MAVTLTHDRSADSVEYTLDGSHSEFQVNTVDWLRGFMELVEAFQEAAVEKDVETVTVRFPSRGTYTTVDEETGEETVHHRRAHDPTTDSLTVEILPSGMHAVTCPLSEFYHFIEKNLHRLVRESTISYDSVMPQEDEDGFMPVVNTKKLRRQKKKQVNRVLKQMSRRA